MPAPSKPSPFAAAVQRPGAAWPQRPAYRAQPVGMIHAMASERPLDERTGPPAQRLTPTGPAAEPRIGHLIEVFGEVPSLANGGMHNAHENDPAALTQLRQTQHETLDLIHRHADMFRHDFPDWLQENWHVWQRFERESHAVWDTGRRHYSARTLVEFIRHETLIREANATFKINNSYVPDVGRLYGMVHPERADFFECRVMSGNGARQRIRGVEQNSAV